MCLSLGLNHAEIKCASIVSNADIHAHEILKIHEDRIAAGLIQHQVARDGVPYAGIPIEFFYGSDYFNGKDGQPITCGCHSHCAFKPVDQRTVLRMPPDSLKTRPQTVWTEERINSLDSAQFSDEQKELMTEYIQSEYCVGGVADVSPDWSPATEEVRGIKFDYCCFIPHS